MRIIAKAHILYNAVMYKPGEELPNNNPEMVKAWKEAGTVEVVEDEKKLDSESRKDEKKPDSESPEDGGTGSDSQDSPPELYTKEQLDKLPSKPAVVAYAEGIGLSGLDVNLHRTELTDKVLAFIEEVKKKDDV